MGYYGRGDYYRGDYYRGDFFGGLLGGIKGALGGIASGNPFAAIGGAISGAVSGSRGAPAAPPSPPGAGIMGFSLPPGGGIRTPFGGIGTLKPGAAGGQPGMKGYHLNKAKLYPSHAHPNGAAPGTVLVRNRHMHVTNPRALARASRRAHGFIKMASHIVRYYKPHARKGRPYIGRRRRSR